MKVKVGIIGVGNMGAVHVKFFMDGGIANGVVSAIADTDPQRLSYIRQLYPGSYTSFTDGAELIDKADADAVIIATPHYSHPELSVRALKKGLHTLCEKPAGVFTRQVKEMNAAAAVSGKLFTVMFNQRTNPVYRKMRELIAGGSIGGIKRINWIVTDWYRTQEYYDSGLWRATWAGEGGGVLLNQAFHQLDLLQWVTGMMPVKVKARCHFGKWHDIETEDDVSAYLEYGNGATGVFITSTGDTPGTNRFEVLGTKGKLVCENGKLNVLLLNEDERLFSKKPGECYGQPGFEPMDICTDGDNPMHAGIVNNFVNAILGTELLFADGKEGLNGVTLANAMLLSAWLDKTVELPFDDALYLRELNKRIAISKIKKKIAAAAGGKKQPYLKEFMNK